METLPEWVPYCLGVILPDPEGTRQRRFGEDTATLPACGAVQGDVVDHQRPGDGGVGVQPAATAAAVRLSRRQIDRGPAAAGDARAVRPGSIGSSASGSAGHHKFLLSKNTQFDKVRAIDPHASVLRAAATKSIVLGILVLITARLFVDYHVMHPFFMLAFLVLTAVTFSLLGFIIGVLADGFEQLQIVPLMIIMPLVFLGGTFYSIEMLPAFWQKVTLFNPVVYLVSGFRWSFFETSDVSVGISLTVISLFLVACVVGVSWIFRTGYRLKS